MDWVTVKEMGSFEAIRGDYTLEVSPLEQFYHLALDMYRIVRHVGIRIDTSKVAVSYADGGILLRSLETYLSQRGASQPAQQAARIWKAYGPVMRSEVFPGCVYLEPGYLCIREDAECATRLPI